jgi:hypothetical protein
MAQQAGIVKGDVLQKIGSAALIIGSLLVAIGNTWTAMVDLSNPALAQSRIGAQIMLSYVAVLLVLFGWWAALIGAAAIQQSITGPGGAWARVGLYFMIMGTLLWSLGIVLDIEYFDLIAKWLAAPPQGKELAHGVLVTLFPPGAGFGRGLFPVTLMCSWLAFAFLGLGMLQSAFYPRWLGWLGSILGAIGVLLGIVMTFTGREPYFMIFTVLAFASIVWLLMTGIWMVRRAW